MLQSHRMARARPWPWPGPSLAPYLKYKKLFENLPKSVQIWPWTCSFFQVQISWRVFLKTKGPGPMGPAHGPGLIVGLIFGSIFISGPISGPMFGPFFIGPIPGPIYPVWAGPIYPVRAGPIYPVWAADRTELRSIDRGGYSRLCSTGAMCYPPAEEQRTLD